VDTSIWSFFAEVTHTHYAKMLGHLNMSRENSRNQSWYLSR